jgi:hypothetical protein
MSIEMADQADFDHTSLQEVANAVQNTSGTDDIISSTAQKRKRSESADDARRSSSKRVSPITSNGNETADAAFMDTQQDSDNAVESLQDYSALHQQNDLENSNGANDHANASSTAAAALGIYPTMTIPQATGVSFAQQAAEDDRNNDSFMDDSQVGNDSFMENSGVPSSTGRSGSGSKPAVGSEEWHKVRKDNHKEGKLFEPYSSNPYLICCKLNAVAARLLTKVSMSYLRLFQDVRRTKAQFCSALCNLSFN